MDFKLIVILLAVLGSLYSLMLNVVRHFSANNPTPENLKDVYDADTYNKWKHLDCIRAFVYDDGYDYSKLLKIDCYCPAYDKSGKLSHELTCDKCKICFQKKAKVCGCYSH